MTDSHADNIERFFRHIEPWSRAFRSCTFHYFGVVTGSEVHLCIARIRLQIGRPPPRRIIEIGRLRAGVMAIPGRCSRAREIVEKLVSGTAVSIQPGLVARLPIDGVAGMYVEPPTLLHPEGLSGGRRLSVLTIQAGQWSIAENRIDLDWSLKSAREPFEGLAVLLGELGLAEHASRRYTLEVVALPPVEVSMQSAGRGENATIGIWIPKGLNKGPASLHYRVLARNAPTVRASLPARQLAWMRDENANVGTTEIRVPRGAGPQAPNVTPRSGRSRASRPIWLPPGAAPRKMLGEN